MSNSSTPSADATAAAVADTAAAVVIAVPAVANTAVAVAISVPTVDDTAAAVAIAVPAVTDTAAAVAIAVPANIAAPVVNNVSIVNTASVVNTSVVLNTSSDDNAPDNSPGVVNNVSVVNTDSVVDHSVVIHTNCPDVNAPARKPAPSDLTLTGLDCTTPSTENKKGPHSLTTPIRRKSRKRKTGKYSDDEIKEYVDRIKRLSADNGDKKYGKDFHAVCVLLDSQVRTPDDENTLRMARLVAKESSDFHIRKCKNDFSLFTS